MMSLQIPITRRRLTSLLSSIAFAVAAMPLMAQGLDDAAKLDFFETKIRPVLVQHCYECHAADAKIVRGGLQLDSKVATLKGGDSGASIVPGKPEDSLLISAIKHESLAMPPKSKLPDNVIADFETWIRDGAVDPREEARPAKLPPVDYEAAKSHWAIQKISDPSPPAGSKRHMGRFAD